MSIRLGQMDGSRASILAFQVAGGGSWRGGVGTAPPEPERDPPPEREWGLSAGQVALAVLVILAACEVIGLLG